MGKKTNKKRFKKGGKFTLEDIKNGVQKGKDFLGLQSFSKIGKNVGSFIGKNTGKALGKSRTALASKLLESGATAIAIAYPPLAPLALAAPALDWLGVNIGTTIGNAIGSGIGATIGLLLDKTIPWAFTITKDIAVSVGDTVVSAILSTPGNKWKMLEKMANKTWKDKQKIFIIFNRIIDDLKEEDLSDVDRLDNIHCAMVCANRLLPELIDDDIQLKYYGEVIKKMEEVIGDGEKDILLFDRLKEELMKYLDIIRNYMDSIAKPSIEEGKKVGAKWSIKEWFFYCVIPAAIIIPFASYLFFALCSSATLPSSATIGIIVKNNSTAPIIGQLKSFMGESFKFIHSIVRKEEDGSVLPAPNPSPNVFKRLRDAYVLGMEYLFSGTARQEAYVPPILTIEEELNSALDSQWAKTFHADHYAKWYNVVENNKTLFDKYFPINLFFPERWSPQAVMKFLVSKTLDGWELLAKNLDYYGHAGLRATIGDTLGYAFEYGNWALTWVSPLDWYKDIAYNEVRKWSGSGRNYKKQRIKKLKKHIKELDNYQGGWIHQLNNSYVHELNHLL